jgi:hypothetical protein
VITVNGRDPWLRRGLTGVGLATPRALAPALRVTVRREVRVVRLIPPRGAIPFSYERPDPLPQPTDGRLKTDVSVVGVTMQPAPVAPPLATPPAPCRAESGLRYSRL